MENFLITQDVDTAMLFTKQGFKMVQNQNNTWVFVNSPEMMEANKQLFARKKVKYKTTNKLCI